MSDITPQQQNNPQSSSGEDKKLIQPQPIVGSVQSSTTINQDPTISNLADPYIGLTGSQMQEKKKPTPIGIYFIGGLGIIGFIVSFFNTSQYSGLFSISMILNLVLAMGLLLHFELARKIYVWLSGFFILMYIIIVILLVLLVHRVGQLQTNLNNSVNQVEQTNTTITQDQKQQLNAVRDQLNNEQKQVGKEISLSYFVYGFFVLENVAVIVYLTRPKVKEAFHE